MMNHLKTATAITLACCLVAAGQANNSPESAKAEKAFLGWAKTPPMGWNSWDSFGTTLNEEQAKAQADAMASELKPCGWDIFTVDIQWYEGGTAGHTYKEGAALTMDEFSRLTPAIEKFPSATNGAGFKPLADYIHAKGLKFGIHILRGIARQAVRANSAIKGTSARAADIALTTSTCPWNPDMYGVDVSKPGGQAYYDSLFAMYAAWGVDYVKVDDISRAYDDVQKAEIEAIRSAIDKTGRPMVLSLSPGDTPIERASHVNQFANAWRISDDFWDRWPPLFGMFERLNRWAPYRRQGAWPDADMLPFGSIEFGRPTHFTQDEARLCMTLWCIARSPLILGADMTRLDPFTKSLLTNKEVLEVSQASVDNHQLSRQGDLIVWTAQVPESRDRYVALFNAESGDIPFDTSKPLYKSSIIRGEPGRNSADIHVSIANAKKLVLLVNDGGDGFEYDHSCWMDPKLTGPKGQLALTDLKWVSAKTGWGDARVDRTVEDHPLMLNGQPIHGIGVHSKSVIIYDLPEGYDTFTAKGVLLPESLGRGSVEFAVVTDSASPAATDCQEVSVSLTDLGMTGSVKVRDLWAHQDLGSFKGIFARDIPIHGAGLFRISPE